MDTGFSVSQCCRWSSLDLRGSELKMGGLLSQVLRIAVAEHPATVQRGECRAVNPTDEIVITTLPSTNPAPVRQLLCIAK